MAALERPMNTWSAYFRVDEMPMLMELRHVTVVRTNPWDHEPVPYYYTMVNSVGVWPGTDSDEWIEYIPPVDKPCWGLYWGV
jgi:hypothetical protein